MSSILGRVLDSSMFYILSSVSISKTCCGLREACFGFWGPFLESLGNFSGPKSNIQIEI